MLNVSEQTSKDSFFDLKKQTQVLLDLIVSCVMSAISFARGFLDFINASPTAYHAVGNENLQHL
jgi:hypothetical protein